MLLYSLLLLSLVTKVIAMAGTCSYDDSDPAPTGIDPEFCSSYLVDHCASLTSLDAEKVSTYCDCLLTLETGTVTPVGNNTQITRVSASTTENQGPATVNPSTSSGLASLTLSQSHSSGRVSVSASNTSPPSTETHISTSEQDGNSTVSASITESGAASLSASTTRASASTTSMASMSPSNFANSSMSTLVSSKQDGVFESLATSTTTSFAASASAISSNTTQVHTSILSQQSISGTIAPATRNNTWSNASPSNGTSTYSPMVSTPSGSSVPVTQSPATIRSNATIRVPTTSHASEPTSVNTPSHLDTNSSLPVLTPSGWNATHTGTGAATQTSLVVNATWSTPLASSNNTIRPTSSTAHVTLNGTISPVTVSFQTRSNDTKVSSATPTRLTSPAFTPITGNITGSATTVAISELTPITTPGLPYTLSPGFSWSTITPSLNATATQSTFSAANFTSVTHTAAATKETCYQLAQGHQEDSTRRALMRNAKLREQNVTIPSPYLESISFESDGVDPLYLTVRDSAGTTSYLDISNKSQIAISDQDGVAVKLDAQGIYFSSHDCRYDVSILVGDLLKQLAKLSGVECSTGGKLKKRMSDIPFVQSLTLHDQCNDPVTRSIRDYPKLSVGTSECVVMSTEESTGFWEFDCAFPGAESGTLQCQAAIKNDVVDFLTTDPFGGECPDLSTVITTLGASGQDFLSKDSLRAELLNQGFTDNDDPELDSILDSYQRAWAALQAVFEKEGAGDSALERYLDLYNKHRDFATDVCEDLHAGEIPLDLTLEAGASRFVITSLNFAPEGSPPWNITVQDPAKEACCAHGSIAIDERERNGTCGYPKKASIGDSGCVCGKTTSGESVAFEITECGNYVQSGCTSDQDCSDGGHSGFVCLTGTCCGSGVCIDPYACSDNSTQLVTYDPLYI